MNNYFKPASGLNEKEKNLDYVSDYLNTIVSGKVYDAVCELGTLCGGGRIIVSFEKLQKMVNLGCNIVRAEYINKDMIDIEYQEFRKNESKHR